MVVGPQSGRGSTMRSVLVMGLGVFASACGGGGGGSGGGAPPPGPLLLTTSVASASQATITYGVTGTYTDSGGTRAVLGSMIGASLPSAVVHLVGFDDNSEGTLTVNIGETVLSTTTRTYGHRFDALDLYSEGARRLGDGTDVYWPAGIGASPITYDVGDSWDLNTTVTPDLVGYDASDGSPRLILRDYRWQVAGVEAVQVPLGWYYCYVVDVYEAYDDLLTGLNNATAARIYVRPEFGPIYMEQEVLSVSGVASATLTLTVSAVTVH
jgi:hypothetical protein